MFKCTLYGLDHPILSSYLYFCHLRPVFLLRFEEKLQLQSVANANFDFLNCFKNPDYALGHPVFTNHYAVDIHSVFYSDFEKNYALTEWPNANWAILIDLKNHILLWVTLYLPNIMVDIHFFYSYSKKKYYYRVTQYKMSLFHWFKKTHYVLGHPVLTYLYGWHPRLHQVKDEHNHKIVIL